MNFASSQLRNEIYIPGTWSQSGSSLYTQGNVGIGTASPSYILDVNGQSRIGNPALITDASTVLRITTSGGASYIESGTALTAYSVADIVFTGIFATPEFMRIKSTGNVGIGTANPSYPLDVLSSSTSLFRIQCSNDPATMVISTYNDTTKDCAIRNNNGQLGFTASSTPGTPFIKFFSGASGAFTNLLGGFSSTLTGGATTLSVDASGYIIRTPSDERLKTDVQPISYGLDTVNSFRPVSYNWNEPEKYGSGRSIGLIAQEVGELVPEAVSAGGDEDKILSLDYQKLVPVLTKAIQELSQENTLLKSQLQSLEQRLAALEGTIGSRVGA